MRRGLEAQLAERERVLADGVEAVGWKLGFGAPAAMEKLGTPAPLVGFLTSRSVLEGDAAGVGGWSNPMLEPEIALRVARGADGVSIASVAPAFELIDLSPPPEDPEAILAGNIYHRHVVFGSEVDAGDVDLSALRAVNSVNGERTEVDEPQALTGPLPGLLQHVDALLSGFGIELADDARIICGSIVPPISVSPGDRIEYRLDGVGELSLAIQE